MFTIAALTGTRADYGLLRPVLQKLMAAPQVDLRLLVTGSHLARQFGYTVAEIEADGLPIAARLDILAESVPEGHAGTARRTATALCLFLAELEANRPDALLLLGDRYEAFAAASAAALLDIPVVHISGGEVTHGADDDFFRHCISKMAKLHFPSCALHRRRLLCMGEQPAFVHDVGGLGDENIRGLQLLSRAALAESLGLALDKPFALVTFHPETATGMPPKTQAEALLAAVAQHPELFYLFTAANADAGGEVMNACYERFCREHTNAALFSSLGVLRYLSAMRETALVLGNSSSGVVETPSLGTPTVNIGARQEGRMLCQNVIQCPVDSAAISTAIAKAQTEAFGAVARRTTSPYNGGDTSGRLVAVLLEALAAKSLLPAKIFYDGEREV